MTSLLRFETRRATSTLAAPAGIAGLLFGVAFMSALVGLGYGSGRQTSNAAICIVLGAVFAAFAGLHSMDRNKGTLVEDIWSGLSPAWRPQIVALYLAWLPVAALQALLIAAVVSLTGGRSLWDLAFLAGGVLLGIPAGLFLTALSRRISGVSVVAVFVLLGILGTVNYVAAPLAAGRPEAGAVPLLAYFAVATVGFLALTLGTGRRR